MVKIFLPTICTELLTKYKKPWEKGIENWNFYVFFVFCFLIRYTRTRGFVIFSELIRLDFTKIVGILFRSNVSLYCLKLLFFLQISCSLIVFDDSSYWIFVLLAIFVVIMTILGVIGILLVSKRVGPKNIGTRKNFLRQGLSLKFTIRRRKFYAKSPWNVKICIDLFFDEIWCIRGGVGLPFGCTSSSDLSMDPHFVLI